MPTLPTFTVTDAVAQRILAAFTGLKDDKGVEMTPAVAYKRWLRSQLVQTVRQREAEAAPDTLSNELT